MNFRDSRKVQFHGNSSTRKRRPPICSIKKFQRLRHEIEIKRATTVTRELHRDHLEHLFELIREEKVVVGLDKEVIYLIIDHVTI